MRVAVPSEVKNHEYRVAITPVGVAELVAHGHEVYLQEGAGRGSAISDAEYVAQGATIVPTADETWAVGEMVLKVKEPVASEFGYLRDDLLLFTYLHLAADQADTDALLNAGTTAIAYETVQLPSGLLPLLYPMSEVAGCLAPQVGAHAMMKGQGGRGVLMGCVGGVPNAKIVVLGGGVAGQNAANVALGMGADVTILDTDLDKLRTTFWRYDNRVSGIVSSRLSVREQVLAADMVIGTVLIPGAKAPKLVTNETGGADEARLGSGGRRHRPGRLFRGLPPDHPRRSDVRRARLGVLLRRQHARRGSQHFDLGADERDPCLRGATGRQGLAPGVQGEPAAGARGQHPWRPDRVPGGRRRVRTPVHPDRRAPRLTLESNRRLPRPLPFLLIAHQTVG